MGSRLVKVDGVEPITIDEVLSWGRIDGAENPAVLGLAVAQAREEAEHLTGRRYRPQTWEVDVLAGVPVLLRDLVPVTSVKQAGLDVPFTSDLVPVVVPPADGVLTIVCGYTDPKDIPPGVRLWMIHRAITSNELRQFVTAAGVAAAPQAFVDGLLDPARIPF